MHPKTRTINTNAMSAQSTHVSCAPLGLDVLLPAHLMSRAMMLYREASRGSPNCLTSHVESRKSGCSLSAKRSGYRASGSSRRDGDTYMSTMGLSGSKSLVHARLEFVV